VFKDFFRVVCQVGIFMVCTQVVLHFRPNKDYEKYMKMLVGAMVLLQIFIPVVRLFSGDGVSDLEGSISGFAQKIEESRKEAEAAGIDADRILEKMTLEQVREALAQQGIGGEGVEEPGAGEQETGQQGTKEQGVGGQGIREQEGALDEGVSASGDSVMQGEDESGKVSGKIESGEIRTGEFESGEAASGEIVIEKVGEVKVAVGSE
jgi:hypothetical protein